MSEIKLTEKEQWMLTIALELEHAGYHSAAVYLRSRVAAIKGLNWAEATTHTDWENILRAHHGSWPPVGTKTS